MVYFKYCLMRINDFWPEFFQLRGFTVNVALTPMPAGVFLLMQDLWSVSSTAACFTVTQCRHLQHRESLLQNIHKPEEIWAGVAIKMSRHTASEWCHNLSGVAFGKQGLKPPEITRSTRKEVDQIICFYHILTLLKQVRSIVKLTCSGIQLIFLLV